MTNDTAASIGFDPKEEATAAHEIAIEARMGEEFTDEQLLQMADRDSSWGANCSKGSC